jgi:hypothetical protein
MLAQLFGEDANISFIVVSYGITFTVLGVLCLYLALDLNKQWRVLRALEKETGKQRWK